MTLVTRRLFRYGSWVIPVLVVGQFVLAGMGVFSLLGPNADAKGATFLMLHALVGPLAIFFLSLVMIGLGFAARLPWRMTGVAAAFVPLLILQSLFLIPYHVAQDDASAAPLRFLSGLHVVNALVIFWVAMEMPFWTRRDLAAIEASPRPISQAEAVGAGAASI